MKKLILIVVATIIAHFAYAHGFDEKELAIKCNDMNIHGTLTTPAHSHGATPLVIIIAGSGPTDRDCNGQGFKSDAYKKLAHGLALNQIATFRFDKRGVGKSTEQKIEEEKMLFDYLVDDVKSLIAHFKKDPTYNQIIICGHSEGALIGMLAADENMKYISLCGVATSADIILKNQLKGKLGDIEEVTFKKIDSLKQNYDVVCDNPMLYSLLRPSVLPYLKSWFKITPTQHIAKFKNPILVIGGGSDLQVADSEASTLASHNPKTVLHIYKNMNHLLVDVVNDEENKASYNKPELPLNQNMINEIVKYCK